MKKSSGGIKFINMAKASLANEGFSLAEVLVASVIISIAVIGVLSAFNLVSQSVRGTGLRADQSRRIDIQLDQISELAEIYTSCSSPGGEVPANPQTVCGVGIPPRSSFYYFPDYAETADVESFFAACRSATAASHITNNFIVAINSLPAPGANISEPVAVRVAPTVPSNHLVRVTWANNPGGRLLREVQIRPVVSSWCP